VQPREQARAIALRRIHHVCLRVADLDEAVPRWAVQFGLTERERAVLALVGSGMPNKVIAMRLGISEKTVRNHLSHLFDKLGVWSRAQAIVFARERGFAADRHSET
jgi:DNA-binding NarL/FixJ family response regulator